MPITIPVATANANVLTGPAFRDQRAREIGAKTTPEAQMSEELNPGPESTLRWRDHSDFPLDWNGPIDRPFENFPDEAKALPIIELLEAVVRRYPERIALADAEASITYAELWLVLTGWAEQITESTEPGDLVAILAPVSTAFPVAILACLAAGRPFVALESDYPAEWIAQVLKDARPSLLLATNADPGAGGPIVGAVRTFDLSDATRRPSPNWQPAKMSADEAACVLFTSGSTGPPKGIVNSQRNLLQRVGQSINAAHINSDDRFLSLASLCSIVGVRDMLTALLTGACLCLLDSQKASTREILRIIRDGRISILFAFPSLLRTVVESSQAGAADHLRLVRVGGDTTLWRDIALLRAWMAPGTMIQLIYAATEAPMMQWFVGELATGDEERVPIGYPLPGNALAVVDADGAPTPQGVVGELLVRSPYVALGTWSRGRCQAQAVQSEVGDQNMRIFKTGDLVRRRPDGLYDRIGRTDRQVKIRGARVELDGVELAIRRHVCVRDVAVVARTDGVAGAASLIAYVQLHDSASDDCLGELAVMMRRAVPPHMRPSRFYATPVIPRLLNSKLDSRVLHAMDLARSKEEADSRASPLGTPWTGSGPIEMAVAHIWREVLGLGLAAVDDDFFDLGGDSLRAIIMTFELEKALGLALPINLINQAPSFAAFCATLRENRPAGYSPLVVLKPGHGSRPLFFIHGVGGGVMELFGLGRKMTWPGPIIGIQARGLDGREPPHKTVEAMTGEYFEAVKARQPQGPYFLCGYSFGGLVAFELARRLSDRGDEVAFVGLIATLPPGHRLLRLWAWAAYLYRRLARGVSDLKSLPFRATRGHTSNEAERPLVLGDASQGRDEAEAGGFAAGALADLQAIALSALSASIAYRPGTYTGELTIFEPVTRDLRLPSSAMLWSHHARALRLHSLKGRHDDMLVGANAETAAQLLTRCLEAAVEATGTSHRAGKLYNRGAITANETLDVG
jgi:amino acid adenylation domain-containing protein